MKLYSTLTGAGENDTKLYERKERKFLKMKKKLTKNGGFTLVEMLIVVAIIAILVAISIPLINSALEKARDATDQANERAAKAEASILVLDQELKFATIPGGATYTNLTNGTGAFYDAEKGKLLAANNAKITPYGRCKNETTCYSYNAAEGAKNDPHDGCIINIKYTADTGEYTITWVTPTGS